MLQKFEPHMVMAPKLVMLQPFLLPIFLYVLSYMFSNEVTAIMMLLAYQILIQQVLPFLLMSVRVNSKTEMMADGLYKLVKILPLDAVASSIMFNEQLLK